MNIQQSDEVTTSYQRDCANIVLVGSPDLDSQDEDMVYQMNYVDQLWKSSMPASPSGFWPRIRLQMDSARDSLQTSLVFLLAFILSPVIGVITLLFWVYRAILMFIIRCKEGSNVSMVDADDSMWLQDESVNRAIINIMLLSKGTPNLNSIRKVFYDRLVDAKDENGAKYYPKLTQYATQTIRRYIWKEEKDFDISQHIYIHPVRLSGSQKQREKVVGDVCTEGLAVNRSAWTTVIFLPEDYEQDCGKETEFFLLFRVHHSVGDGISLIRTLMYSLVDKSPPRVKSNRFCATGIGMRIAKALFQGPSILLQRFTWTGDESKIHGLQLSGKKNLAWSPAIDLAMIKKIKNLTHSTINDVLISCLSAAFTEYFKNYTTLDKHRDGIPAVNAYIPVDIRSGSQSGSRMTNQFALVFLTLPVGNNDMLQTLRITKQRMDSIKLSPEPLVSSFAINYGMNNLPNWATKKVFDWLSSKCSIVLSNVPGPQEVLSIDGNDLTGITFWPPQRGNIGIGVSIFSYNGNVRVGCISDEVLIENPSLIIEEFNEKLKELATLLKID